MQKCDLKAVAKKIRAARAMRKSVPKDLRPLFNHVLKLAADSARRGYCQRAGIEIRHAKRLTRFR